LGPNQSYVGEVSASHLLARTTRINVYVDDPIMVKKGIC